MRCHSPRATRPSGTACLPPPPCSKERSAQLDGLLRRKRRHPGDVRRTALVSVMCTRDAAEMHHVAAEARRNFTGMPPMSSDDLLESLRVQFAAVGTPARAGAEELMVAHITADSNLNLETSAVRAPTLYG
jgi:hypothetical protein